MQVIQRVFPIPASGVVDNILSGSAFEFAKGSSLVSIGLTTTATGLNATIQSGGQSILEESPVIVKSTPISTEDDMYYNFGAIAGDRLVIRVRNTTAGVLNAVCLVQVQPAR